MQLAILIAIGAGLASAALYASASTGTVLGVFVLFFMSPMPVAIAGLGWGWASGTIAAAVGTVLAAFVGGPRSGLVYLVALGAPAAVFSYLALLNRQVEIEPGAGNGHAQSAVATEWYPIGRLVGWASLWAGLVAAAALLGTASDAAGVRAALLDVLEKTKLAEAMGTGGRALTPQEKNAFVALMATLFPWAISTMWFTVAMFNLWLAGHVTRASGRLIRPWPDLSAISLPPALPLAFGASILGTFLADMAGLIAAGFASALMFAFMLLGLAILHRITRGTVLRPAILGTAYAGLIFLQPVSTLLIAMIGLAEPFLRRRTAGGGPPSPT
jgi:hypothetical protein